MASTANDTHKFKIDFADGNQALAVAPPSGAEVAGILQELEIAPPKALILNIGGAAELDQALTSPLTQLFSRAVAPAAIETAALILDGGTRAGVMALMGHGVADCG